MTKWINFYNKLNDKKLGGYTEEGSFKDELQSTIELMAYDKNIEITDIEVRYENE